MYLILSADGKGTKRLEVEVTHKLHIGDVFTLVGDDYPVTVGDKPQAPTAQKAATGPEQYSSPQNPVVMPKVSKPKTPPNKGKPVVVRPSKVKSVKTWQDNGEQSYPDSASPLKRKGSDAGGWDAAVKLQPKRQKKKINYDESSGSDEFVPKDDSDNVDEEYEDGAKPCQYGSTCYRKNLEHWKEFSHPRSVSRPVGYVSAESEDSDAVSEEDPSD